MMLIIKNNILNNKEFFIVKCYCSNSRLWKVLSCEGELGVMNKQVGHYHLIDLVSALLGYGF
jgi:hypothetical protein